MLSASDVAEALRDSVVPQLGCGVSLPEADLRAGDWREVSLIVGDANPWGESVDVPAVHGSTMLSN